MEDDSEIASLYSLVLQERGHKVTLAPTAEDCLKIYSKSLHRVQMKKNILKYVQPYDAVTTRIFWFIWFRFRFRLHLSYGF